MKPGRESAGSVALRKPEPANGDEVCTEDNTDAPTGVALALPDDSLLELPGGFVLAFDVQSIPPRAPTEHARGAIHDPAFARRITKSN